MKRLAFFLLAIPIICGCNQNNYRNYYWDGVMGCGSDASLTVQCYFLDDGNDIWTINIFQLDESGNTIPGCGASVIFFTEKHGDFVFDPFQFTYKSKSGEILSTTIRKGNVAGDNLSFLGFDYVDGAVINSYIITKRGPETPMYRLKKMAKG